MNEFETRLGGVILTRLHEVLDGFDECFGQKVVGNDSMRFLDLTVADVTQDEGYYRFIGTFTDTGPSDERQARLGTILSTLGISEFANVNGPLRRTADTLTIGLQVHESRL